MVVHKLNFRATCISIHHARARGDTNDHLFVKWAADSTAWALRNEHSGCAEYTAFRAAYILSIDEEARIALRKFYQSFIDCA